MRPFQLTACAALTCAAVLSAGCNSEKVGTTVPPSATQPAPQNPEVPPPNPPKAKYAGVYKADAPIDLTANMALGEWSPVLGALSTLHDDPGKSIVDIAVANKLAGIDGVPTFLRSVLANLLTQEIAKVYKDDPTLDDVARLLMGMTEFAKTISIHNLLTVHQPDGNLNAQIEQQITDVGFVMLDRKLDVPVPVAAKSAALFKMPGVVKPHANAPVADADVTIMGGKASLPLGSFIMEALGPLVFQPDFGASDLKSILLKAVPCDTVGQKVADGSGIGAALVTSVCKAGVQAIADDITAQISKITKDVQVTNVKGVLYDVSPSHPVVDYKSDRIGDGTWTWKFGMVDVPSTFAGDRVADAN
jgi:hypothetical protein